MTEVSKRNKELREIIDKIISLNDNLSEHIEIISNAGYGIWHIILKDGEKPRMQVNEKMSELLDIDSTVMTEEEIYNSWYDYILPEAIPSVQLSVQEMMDGKFSENTYKWKHPSKGVIYVRCGGTSMKLSDDTTVIRGYHTDVTEIVHKEQEQKEILREAKCLADARNVELTKQLKIINTIAKVFNCIYFFSLKDYSFMELGSEMELVSNLVSNKTDAREAFKGVYKVILSPEMRAEGEEFMNLETLNERLQGKEWISRQFYGPINGWFEGLFIVADRDEDGNCNHVIWATRDINESKMREESLIHKSNIDELTHMYNRWAYEEMIGIYESNGIPDDLVYISIDVNGLKVVNDTMGHEAGDKLIRTACQYMTRAFGRHGKIFRTGGDEFIAMLNVSAKTLEHLKKDIDKLNNNWYEEVAVSCGYVARWEAKELSIQEIASIADQRMYKAKEAYYKNKGIDRKGQKEAHAALELLYSKILKINITDDTYQILDIGKEENIEEVRNIGSISGWLKQFANSDSIHPDYSQEFMEKTDFGYLKNYFREGKKRFGFIYKKNYDGVYKDTIMEIIPANDYSEELQTFFLYVKRIED